MKRRYQRLLRAPLIAAVLLCAGLPIGWLSKPVSADTGAAAIFITNMLFVSGTDGNDAIIVFADANGSLVVTNDNVAVPIFILSGTADKLNTSLVIVSGNDGNDSIRLAPSLNVLDRNARLAIAPNAALSGGAGNDILTSEIGGFIGGISGNPVVGNVVMDGGRGDDILVSGFGNDMLIGDAGNDTLHHRPGALIDFFNGGGGFDTAEFVGNDNNEGDAMVVGIDPNQPDQALVTRTNPVQFFVQVQNIEDIALSTQSGNDTVTINNLSGTRVKRVRVNGGVGNDFINGASSGVILELDGSDGNDILLGGAGSDTLTGGAGNDQIFGGDGMDSIFANDGQGDQISCGNGKDQVFIDPPPLDVVDVDCEAVKEK